MAVTAIEQAPQDTDEETAEEHRPRWELAECTCPDYCERDHERD